MANERYPIGEYQSEEVITSDKIAQWIEDIRILPDQLKKAVKGLNDEELQKTYRENGWTICQLVHHIADSSMNSYIRIKLALTEETPTIKPYDEAEWAKLPDYHLPIVGQLKLIEGLFESFVYLLENLSDEQLKRTLYHPVGGISTIEENISFTAWHVKHHFAHIQNALK